MDRCLLPLPRRWRQRLHELALSGSGHIRPYWSISLPGKWKVHRALSREKQLSRLLVPTLLLQPHAPWEQWLKRWPKGLFFKPVSGTHGKETFRLTQENDTPHGSLKAEIRTMNVISADFIHVMRSQPGLNPRFPVAG